MGPRVFTVREANELLPAIEDIFRDIDRIRELLRTVKGKIDVLEMIWGEEIRQETNPDRREFAHYTAELERLRREFDAAGRKFVELEVHLKSVEAGLIDFHAVLDRRIVFLCWKRGEKSVQWYHHVDEGFAGRRRIPAEELAR